VCSVIWFTLSVDLVACCSFKCVICFCARTMRIIDANCRLMKYALAEPPSYCSVSSTSTSCFCLVQDFLTIETTACRAFKSPAINSTMYTTIHELIHKSNSIAFVDRCTNLLVWAAIHITHLLLHYRTTSRLFLFIGSAPAVPFLIIATNSE